MPPIPCAHCGVNFMRQTTDPEAPRLCNNCIIKEQKRNIPKKEQAMNIVDIVIKCPVETYVLIEEYCSNQGMDFTKYFLSLHDAFKDTSDAFESEKKESVQIVSDTKERKESVSLKKKSKK